MWGGRTALREINDLRKSPLLAQRTREKWGTQPPIPANEIKDPPSGTSTNYFAKK